MKKALTLLLAAAMLLTLTACGDAAEPAETAPATTEPTVGMTEAPTENNESTVGVTEAPTENNEEFVSLAEELLKSEDTITVSFTSPAEYEEALHKLGYTEFVLNYYAENGELACKPVSLTYNDNAFRFDFEYWDYPVVDGVTNFNEIILVEGFVLYGTKAESNLNISTINFEDYQVVLPLDWLEVVASDNVRAWDYCPQIVTTNCFDMDENGNMSNWAFHESDYYPLTGNLYNFVHIADTMNDARYSSPRLLKDWIEALMDAWESMGVPHFTFVLGNLTDENDIVINDGAHIYLSTATYCFEEGMTLQEWAESIYNVDGWQYVNDDMGGALYSPENNYVVIAGPEGSLPVIYHPQTGGFNEVVVLNYGDYCRYAGK